jgi:hypothetical protein
LDVHPTTIVLLQSLIFLLQPPKAAPAGLPASSSHGRLCCRMSLTTPPYSHRWPGHPFTHPRLRLFNGDGTLTTQPIVNPCTPLRVGIRCRVFPVFGSFPLYASPSSTALVLSARGGQHGQQMTAIGRGIYVERLTEGTHMVHGCTEASALLHQKNWLLP